MKTLALRSAVTLFVQLSCPAAYGASFEDLTYAAIQPALQLQVAQSLSLPGSAATAAAENAWPPASRKEFIAAVWPHAERAARQIGVTPHAIVAQAALESAWGRRAIGASGQPSFNLFGIKAGPAWTGDRTEVATHEYVRGVRREGYANFRSYESMADAFDDYVSMLRANPRYAAALKHGGTSRHFAARLQRAGYSTDPHYATKIHRIANSSIVRSSKPASAGHGKAQRRAIKSASSRRARSQALKGN